MAQQLCEQFKGLRYQPYVKLRRVKVKPGQVVYLRRPTKLLDTKSTVNCKEKKSKKEKVNSGNVNADGSSTAHCDAAKAKRALFLSSEEFSRSLDNASRSTVPGKKQCVSKAQSTTDTKRIKLVFSNNKQSQEAGAENVDSWSCSIIATSLSSKSKPPAADSATAGSAAAAADTLGAVDKCTEIKDTVTITKDKSPDCSKLADSKCDQAPRRKSSTDEERIGVKESTSSSSQQLCDESMCTSSQSAERHVIKCNNVTLCATSKLSKETPKLIATSRAALAAQSAKQVENLLKETSKSAAISQASHTSSQLHKPGRRMSSDKSDQSSNPKGQNEVVTNAENDLLVRVTGLWANSDEAYIRSIFPDCCVMQVHFTYRPNGSKAGTGYVRFKTMADCDRALDRYEFGFLPRSLVVTKTTQREMDWVLKRSRPGFQFKTRSDFVVRLTGLPHDCNATDVKRLLRDCNILDVHFVLSASGLFDDSAYVELADAVDVAKALVKDKQSIAKSVVHVCSASRKQLSAVFDLYKPDESHIDAFFVVWVRGLPIDCCSSDIYSFFTECSVRRISFTHTKAGRNSGEAFVVMSSDADVENAVKKNTRYMNRSCLIVVRSSPGQMQLALQRNRNQHLLENRTALRDDSLHRCVQVTDVFPEEFITLDEYDPEQPTSSPSAVDMEIDDSEEHRDNANTNMASTSATSATSLDGRQVADATPDSISSATYGGGLPTAPSSMPVEQPTVSECKPITPSADGNSSVRKGVTHIKLTHPVAGEPRAGASGDTKHDSAAVGACSDQMPLKSSACGLSISVSAALTDGTVKLNASSESSTATSAAADGTGSSHPRFLELVAHVTNWLTTTNRLEQFRTGGGGGVDTIRVTFPTTGSGDRVVSNQRSVDGREKALRNGDSVDVVTGLLPRVPSSVNPFKLQWNRPLSAAGASQCGQPAVTNRADDGDPVSISDKQDVNLPPRIHQQQQPQGPHDVARKILSKLLDTIRAPHSRKVTVLDETFLMTSSSSVEAEVCQQQQQQSGHTAPLSEQSDPCGEQLMQQTSTYVETVGCAAVVQSMQGIQLQI